MANVTLPMDIIATEILHRLPSVSLLRFKCVSKFFRTLISTPEFVHRHSLSSDAANRQLILVGKVSGLYNFHLYSPELPAVRLRFPGSVAEGSHGRLFLVGSCHGFVCIGMPLSSLIIFNPCTGIYKEIGSMKIFVANSCINYAFGLDDVNDDYKIVRVMSLSSYGYRDDNHGYHPGMSREVSVYSFKSNSWNLVERTSYQDSMKHMENGAVIDNHLVHWRFWHPSNNEHRIGCFDLRNDKWGDDVPLPDYYPEFGSSSSGVNLIHLGVLDGCLCLLTEKPSTIGVNVWVMKEYGLKESWVNLVGISGIDVGRPLKISPFTYGKGSRSEILVRVDSDSKFFWYNIRDRTWRWAEIHGVPPYAEACICKGSLVSNIAGGARFQIGRLEDRRQERMQA